MGWLVVLLILAGAGGAGYWFIVREDGSDSTNGTATSGVDGLSPAAAGSEPVESTEAMGGPYIGPLTFQWQPNCLVPIREVVNKGGNTAELTYRLSTVREGENLVVSFTDMTMLTMNGSPVPVDAAGAVAGFLLPSFVIDPGGNVVEVRGMADVIAQVVALNPDSAAAFTPEVVANLESVVVAKYWNSWVGYWASLGSIDQPRFETTSSSNSSSGSYDTAIVIESLGIGADGQVHLREVQTLEGENFLRALGALLPSISSDPTETGRRVTTIDVTTDPKTLRPSAARILIEIQRTSNGQTQSQLESRDWTLDWAAATCS